MESKEIELQFVKDTREYILELIEKDFKENKKLCVFNKQKIIKQVSLLYYQEIDYIERNYEDYLDGLDNEYENNYKKEYAIQCKFDEFDAYKVGLREGHILAILPALKREIEGDRDSVAARIAYNRLVIALDGERARNRCYTTNLMGGLNNGT